MNDYYEVRIDATPCSEDITDYMAALLADIGYESFVPDTHGLTAYVRSEDYVAEKVSEVLTEMPSDSKYSFNATFIPGRDWNEEWEKNYFKPIIVDNRCVIHSSFHTDIPYFEYDIVIDPKMAFGTGHHATTSLIIAKLLDLPLESKSVIDMGTGTGILAILAAMRGAKVVAAIEIDDFAYENAVENVTLNNHAEINVLNGDASLLVQFCDVDVFIANINRNIITGDINRYAPTLRSGGLMLLSGFYEEDIPVVVEAAKENGLRYISHNVKDRWVVVTLQKI